MNNETIIIFLVMLAFVAFGLAVSIYQSRKRRELLITEAAKRGGEFSQRNIFSRLELHLPFKGNTILIYSIPGSRYSPPRTYAVLKSDAVNLPSIEIVPNSVSQKLLGAFGRERTLTNNEEFDKKFVVRSDDQFMLQRLLSADIMQRLTDRSLRYVEVRIKPNEFQFVIQAIPSSEDGYDIFIDTAMLLLQKIL